MNKGLILFFAISILFACGQEKKSNTTSNIEIFTMQNLKINPTYKDITFDNFEQKILENVKDYPKEPIYYVRLGKANCVIEILLNDYLIYDDYELSNTVTPIEINYGILKSGKQKLTYRLYPTGDLMKESYGGDESTVTTLTELTSVSIKIIQIDNKGPQKLKDEVVVMQHNSLNDKNGKFIASGKPYYEYTFEFQAEVPYEVEGWTNGQDLTKLDQKLLEKKCLEAYKDYADVLLNSDSNNYAKLNFGLEKRNAISLFKNDNRIKNLKAELLLDLNEKKMKLDTINNYTKVFFGDGKIVYLLYNSLEYPYRGGSAVRIFFKNSEGNDAVNMPRVMLYLPEGKKLEDGLFIAE